MGISSEQPLGLGRTEEWELWADKMTLAINMLKSIFLWHTKM